MNTVHGTGAEGGNKKVHSRSHMHPKCHMALNKNSGIMTTRVYSSELPPTQSRYRGAGCKAANAVPTQGYICVSLLKCHQRCPAPRLGFFSEMPPMLSRKKGKC